MTNRDWLMTLSNRKLANMLGAGCNYCIYAKRACEGLWCKDGIFAWLESEHGKGRQKNERADNDKD